MHHRRSKMEEKHFLILTYPAQGHINPALHLAHRLSSSLSVHVTFSTSIYAHRKMFPSISSPNEPIHDHSVTCLPFSDGYDQGFDPKTDNVLHFFSLFKTIGSQSISSLLDKLSSSGRPVDCVLYTFMFPWMAQMARAHGITSAQYWIQSATVFSVYHHAFLHGYEKPIAEKSHDPTYVLEFPGGMMPLRVKDLPSFLTDDSDELSKELAAVFKEAILTLRTEKDVTGRNSKVLVNTFEELEPHALGIDGVDLIAVGPALQTKDADTDLVKTDEKEYSKWLDSKGEGSVVYVSFGSMSVLKKEQVEEIWKGLKGSGRPYLWVLRKDSRYEGMEVGMDGDGKVVGWCAQMEVLRHGSVGCFVSHCGWNSTLESLVCGVPVVAVPQWTDQGTNAVLMEKVWRNAVRWEANGEGLLEGEELTRCLEVVLGEGEEGDLIRRNAEMWKEKAMAALNEGGSSEMNLKLFVDGVPKCSR